MRSGFHGLLTEYWWVFAIGLALIMFMRSYARSRIKSNDMDNLESDEGSVGAPRVGEQSAIHPNFGAVLRRVVMPIRDANPDWERLDGTYGVPGRQVARFNRNGTVYALKSDSNVAALQAAADWMDSNPGEDPLVVQPTKRGEGRLMLRPEIGWPDRKAVQIVTV